MHGEDHVFVGHAHGVAGCADVAASVDGEDLPDLQGACGGERGTKRGEGTGGQTSPGMEPAGLLHVPTPWHLWSRPLGLPPARL